MTTSDIKVGDAVFLRDGSDAIGAVHQMLPGGRSELVIYVENAGDFVVPFTAVKAVHFQKVILDVSRLDKKLRSAIGHAHDAETPDPA